MHNCPIHNFAPDTDSEGRNYTNCDGDGDVCYRIPNANMWYHTYSSYDSEWWEELRYETCEKYTKAVIEWIKNRR